MDRDQPPSKPQLGKVYSRTVYVTVHSDEPKWWNKLLEQVPADQQCKNKGCTFAPPGHRKHGCKERNYSIFEKRLIIKYLVHYNVISFGKGLAVWETMNSRGYLTHRTPDSLNSHFKRRLLKDIKDYRLPAELEQKFVALCV